MKYTILGFNKLNGHYTVLDSYPTMIDAIKALPGFSLAYGANYVVDIKVTN